MREALSEVMRELGVRRRCYARWIQDGKLSDVDATDRLERLERAADIIERSIMLAESVLSPDIKADLNRARDAERVARQDEINRDVASARIAVEARVPQLTTGVTSPVLVTTGTDPFV